LIELVWKIRFRYFEHRLIPRWHCSITSGTTSRRLGTGLTPHDLVLVLAWETSDYSNTCLLSQAGAKE
jgi:hypothetical protein